MHTVKVMLSRFDTIKEGAASKRPDREIALQHLLYHITYGIIL